MPNLQSRDQEMQKLHDYFHMGVGGKWKACGKCIDALERKRKRLEDQETIQRRVDQENARMNIWDGNLTDGDLTENMVKPPAPNKIVRAGSTRKKDRRQTVRRKEVTRHGDRRNS